MKLTAPDGTPLHVQPSEVRRVNYVSRHEAQLLLKDGRALLVQGCSSRIGAHLNGELLHPGSVSAPVTPARKARRR